MPAYMYVVQIHWAGVAK